MVVRRLVTSTALLATAITFFTLGTIHSRRTDAASRALYDAKLDAIRTEFASARKVDPATPAATTGRMTRTPEAPVTLASRARMVTEIKAQLQNEMGLLPVHLLRDRRSSFVELYSSDNFGKTNYGTAGYVGQRTANGLVTCLTDGHPGVSGGGVLDQRGVLVGIPIGRMQGDYRFSFILPIRAEMLRKVPLYEQPEPQQTVVAVEEQK